jgi:amino acid permease
MTDDSAHTVDLEKQGRVVEMQGGNPHGRAAFYVEKSQIDKAGGLDDDGVIARTGNWITTSGHIITAVIGTGVLSLPWAFAQLGWGAGPVLLAMFGAVTLYTTFMLADCYRAPDPVTGKRTYTYIGAVGTILGPRAKWWVGLAQYANLIGTGIGYTITAGICMVAARRSICFHKHPAELQEALANDDTICKVSNTPFMLIFGAIQIVMSQIPDFDKLYGLSYLAAAMSFIYSFITLGLVIGRAAEDNHPTGTAGGIPVSELGQADKVWGVFNALGALAFAFSFSNIMIEIQDTIAPAKPPKNISERTAMKKAAAFSVAVTTFFYMTIGVIGYAAWGNDAPGNILTGFGFYNPYWLISMANIFVVVHLVGAYQTWTMPWYGFVEQQVLKHIPSNPITHKEFLVPIPFVGVWRLNMFRLGWRTLYVCFTTVVALLLPFFNDVVGILGALGFWPLTIIAPILMYIKMHSIKRWSPMWIWLQALQLVCLAVTLAAAIGAVAQLRIDTSGGWTPFTTVY